MESNKVIIKSLSLSNFKGIKSLAIDFSPKETSIFGTNGTGKTSIFDAYCWVLYGKNSNDEHEFNIKPFDSQNEPIHKLESCVELIYLINDNQVKFRKIFKEKWQKPKGNPIEEFTGHEISYYYNDLPVTMKDYKAYVESIAPESIFKIVSNPMYFNTTFQWAERRKLLFSLVQDISDIELAKSNPEFKVIADNLTNKSFEDYRKYIGTEINRLKKEITHIPSKIEELNLSKPVIDNIGELESNLSLFNAKLKEVESIIKAFDSKEASPQIKFVENAITDKKNELRTAVDKIYSDISVTKENLKASMNTISMDKTKVEIELSRTTANIVSLTQDISTKEQNLEKLRNEFKSVTSSEIDLSNIQTMCPTCKREFANADIETKSKELTENFNKEKANKLNNLNVVGTDLKESLAKSKQVLENSLLNKEEYQTKINTFTEQYRSLSKELDQLSLSYEQQVAAEKNKIQEQITELENSLSQLKNQDSESITSTINEKQMLVYNISELNKKLGVKEHIKSIEARIAELTSYLAKYHQEIADLEKQEYVIAQFVMAKIDAVEAKINSLFKSANFKLYKKQINGEVSEDCICIYNGVPYSDLNHASKINIGIDVINTIAKVKGVSLPIFIDNKESIVTLNESVGQLVSLIVSGDDKSLRIERK